MVFEQPFALTEGSPGLGEDPVLGMERAQLLLRELRVQLDLRPA